MGKKVGIDLGTTNSVVAILEGTQVKVLDNLDAKPQTRSVVSLRKPRGRTAATTEEMLVGNPAMDNWPMSPRDTVISIKRLMGRAAGDREVQEVAKRYLYRIKEPSDGTRDSVRVMIGNKEYSPIEVSALILRKLKHDAEVKLGEPVTHAVITVPAYFSQIQREATWRAAQLAGLKVIKLLDEPTAAAVAVGFDAGERDETKTVLVYDLGGGTFDISVLMMAGGTFAPLALKGDMWLGGDDFDQVLVEHALQYVQSEYGLDPNTNLRFMVELKKAAKAIKERLSSSQSALLVVPGLLRDADDNLIDVEMEISQAQYASMISPLVARTVQLTNEAIKEARLTADQIDFVLLAGNSTCVPAVREAMQNISWFKLTDASLGKLASNGVPDAVANKLKPLKDKCFPAEIDYVDELRKLLAPDIFSAHKAALTAIARMRFGEKVLLKENPKHLVAQGAAIIATRFGDQVVCPHPDPANPTDPMKECGHVNDLAATHCAHCRKELTVDGKPREPGDDIGQVAAFHYGMQTAGDKFNVFVSKSDPYPTHEDIRQARSFPTRYANQRVISIPVYGGENLDKASANEKQGEALAILPPRQQAGTPVRIKLWLNRDGIFELTAHLQDGTDLQPWISTGGTDAKAVTEIEEATQALAQHAGALAPAAVAELQKKLERAYEQMRRKDFISALATAQTVATEVKQAASKKKRPELSPEEEQQAQVRFVEWVTERFAWLITTAPELAEQLIPRILKMEMDIRSQIQAASPAEGQNLLEELQEVEDSLKRDFPATERMAPSQRADSLRRFQTLIEQRLSPLEAKVADALARTGQTGSDLGADRWKLGNFCSKGHLIPSGKAKCPTCGEAVAAHR